MSPQSRHRPLAACCYVILVTAVLSRHASSGENRQETVRAGLRGWYKYFLFSPFPTLPLFSSLCLLA
jgi:hypothetical protein